MFKALREELFQKGVLTFRVHVRPNSPVTKLTGMLEDGTLKIDVASPPDKGKANTALIRYLSKELATSKIEIIAGHTSRRKIVQAQVKLP